MPRSQRLCERGTSRYRSVPFRAIGSPQPNHAEIHLASFRPVLESKPGMTPILLYDLEEVPDEQLLAVLLSWRLASPSAPIYVLTKRRELPHMGSPALDGGCISVDPEEYASLDEELGAVYVSIGDAAPNLLRASLKRWLTIARFAEQQCASHFLCATTSTLIFVPPDLIISLLSAETRLVCTSTSDWGLAAFREAGILSQFSAFVVGFFREREQLALFVRDALLSGRSGNLVSEAELLRHFLVSAGLPHISLYEQCENALFDPNICVDDARYQQFSGMRRITWEGSVPLAHRVPGNERIPLASAGFPGNGAKLILPFFRKFLETRQEVHSGSVN